MTRGSGGGRAWSSGGGVSSGQGGSDYGGCWQGTRGAHLKHVLHGCDAGGVEAQWLVESRRALPSREGSIRRGATCGAGRRQGVSGGGGASNVLGGPSSGGRWQGTRGAHVKHAVHGCDAGGVEAQRLVKRRRVLPSREGSIRRQATCGAGRREGVFGGGGASNVQGGPNCDGSGQGTRGAHVKHVRYGCDAGSVEAQRLVEGRRVLPSRKGSIRRGATWGSAKGRGEAEAAQAARRENQTVVVEGRARAECT